MSGNRIASTERVERTETIIEKKIIRDIYSQRQDIFQDTNRFQVVLSQPTHGFKFQEIRKIYKGKFICRERNCSRWSSSSTYVRLFYYSKPASLNQLLNIYNRSRTKISIFIYVQLLGQKCRQCMGRYRQYMGRYESPFFGGTELKRMHKNFSKQICETILFGERIGQQQKCQLRELKGHQSRFCEACEKGICRTQAAKGKGRRRGRGRRN